MKYIVCNLKKHLNEYNIKDYLDTIKKITYNNVIFCVPNNYINLFKNYKICTQDYYDDVKKEYALINHYDKKEDKEITLEKINKALNNNIKVILCIGNSNVKDYSEIKKQLDYFVGNKKNIIIAYEPYNMIGTNNQIEINDIKNIITKIKDNFNNNIVLYGGNVGISNINDILDVCDGVLIGRLSFNPHKLTKILNNIV